MIVPETFDLIEKDSRLLPQPYRPNARSEAAAGIRVMSPARAPRGLVVAELTVDEQSPSHAKFDMFDTATSKLLVQKSGSECV